MSKATAAKPAAAASKAAPARPAAAKAAAPAAKKAEEKKSEAVARSTPITAAARPLVAVRKLDAEGVLEQLLLPSVFVAPIRPDIVHFVHTK
jgi:hypothetical protein